MSNIKLFTGQAPQWGNLLCLTGRQQRVFYAFVYAVVAAVVLLAATPGFAHASWLTDPWGSLMESLNSALIAGLNGLYTEILNVDQSSYLTTEVTDSLIANKDGLMGKYFGYVVGAYDAVAKPLAAVFFALFLLLELFGGAVANERANGIPGVEITFKILLKAVILYIVVFHALEITLGLFNIGQVGAGRVINFVFGGVTDVQISSGAYSSAFSELEGPEFHLFELMALYLAMGIQLVIVELVCCIRVLTGGIYIAFSPLAFMTLAHNETKQIGIGYIRSFAAICIQGFILAFITGSLPVIFSTFTIGTTQSLAIVTMLVPLIITIYLTLKSSTFARQIVGL